MIKIAYCLDHGRTKTVVASSDVLGDVIHTHPDLSDHACTVIEVDEAQPTSYPHTTDDETSVVDTDAWLTYLEKYVP